MAKKKKKTTKKEEKTPLLNYYEEKGVLINVTIEESDTTVDIFNKIKAMIS